MIEKTLSRAIINALPMLIIFIVVISAVRIYSLKNSNKKLVLHNEILNLFNDRESELNEEN